MILDGKKLSTELINQLKIKVSKLKTKPKVVDIVIGENSSNNLYIRNKKKACIKVGIEFELVSLPSQISEKEIITLINKLNNNQLVDGIMIQLPLPKHFNTGKIINHINSKKDIDGLTQYNQIKLYNNEADIIPCTPKGILKILDYYNISIKGKHVVIIGRSNLVGKPLMNLLLNQDATVTICHSKTKELLKFTKNADILICAINKANMIKKEMVKSNCIIIDTGIIYINNEIQGNVDQSVIEKVKYITPVPGGVGPMTVAMFLENIVLCYNKNKKNGSSETSEETIATFDKK